jgi:hypothetical protein
MRRQTQRAKYPYRALKAYRSSSSLQAYNDTEPDHAPAASPSEYRLEFGNQGDAHNQLAGAASGVD